MYNMYQEKKRCNRLLNMGVSPATVFTVDAYDFVL